MTTLAPKDLPNYVRSAAPLYGLDPAAVLAMSQHEGLVGGHGNPGDNNTSFGPWQLHINGALPSNIAALGPVRAQQWAWSTEGIDYALGQISGYAKNQTGYAAVAHIAQWERSADIPGQTQRAWNSYAGWLGTNIPIALDAFINVIHPNGKQEQIPGGTEVTDGGGNAIVPVPPSTINPTIPGEPTVPALPTGGTQDVRLGTIGPLKVGIPSGLVLGLLGMSFLLIGAILFVYGGQFRASVNTVGGNIRPIRRLASR